MWTLLAAALLSPQSDWERNYACWQNDAGAGSACWADIRALYAAPSIEQLQHQRVQVRRVYFLDLVGRLVRDGRGHDVQAGMISIERPAGDAPRIVYYPARRHGLVTTPIAARISVADWDMVMAATPDVQGWTSDASEICLHGWDFLVEAADSSSGDAGPVQRRHERSCDAGNAWPFANQVAQLAVGALGRCGTPPPQETLWFQIEWLHRCSLQGPSRQ